jgi:hypothetical protein
MADSGLQEVFFYRPLHEVVVDGGFGDALVVRDSFQVVILESREIGELEVELVGEPARKGTL